jgi:hypothetical protein
VWTEQQQLLARDGSPGSAFGSAVSLTGETALLGARWEGSGLDSDRAAGATYVFVFEHRKTDGDPCVEDHECASAWCVDGVCCETDCAQGDPNDCQGCSRAVGATSDGRCEALTGTSCTDREPGICQAGTCEPIEDGGCGCSRPPRPGSVAWVAAGLAGLVAVASERRRRAERRTAR